MKTGQGVVLTLSGSCPGRNQNELYRKGAASPPRAAPIQQLRPLSGIQSNPSDTAALRGLKHRALGNKLLAGTSQPRRGAAEKAGKGLNSPDTVAPCLVAEGPDGCPPITNVPKIAYTLTSASPIAGGKVLGTDR